MKGAAFAAVLTASACLAAVAWGQEEAPTPSPSAEPAPVAPPAPAPKATDPAASPKPTPPAREQRARAERVGPQLGPAPMPFAERWRGNLYAGNRSWVSLDAGFGVSRFDGDPAVTGDESGTGTAARIRALLHLGAVWTLGARFAFDKGSVSPKADSTWGKLQVSQSSFGMVLGVTPLGSDSIELTLAAHGGASQDAFSARSDAETSDRTWAGMAMIAGGGLELTGFPSVSHPGLALSAFAEGELHSAGASTARPPYKDGGLPRQSRATIRLGAALGYHF